MKRTLTGGVLLAVMVGFVSGYTVPSSAQGGSIREDEEAIRKVIAGTTEAFNRHDSKAFAHFYTPDAELVTVRGERMKGGG